MNWISLLIFRKMFYLGSSEKASGNPILNCFGSPWKKKFRAFKPSILMGKLKQHLPHGISPDKDLFLSMFLVRVLPSMRGAVGAGNHKTAVAMVIAADALWDARDGQESGPHGRSCPTTQRSGSPAPTSRKNNRRNGNSCSKGRPTSSSDIFTFQNPGNSMCKFHNFYSYKTH
jgi:hypothetical protein